MLFAANEQKTHKQGDINNSDHDNRFLQVTTSFYGKQLKMLTFFANTFISCELGKFYNKKALPNL